MSLIYAVAVSCSKMMWIQIAENVLCWSNCGFDKKCSACAGNRSISAWPSKYGVLHSNILLQSKLGLWDRNRLVGPANIKAAQVAQTTIQGPGKQLTLNS